VIIKEEIGPAVINVKAIRMTKIECEAEECLLCDLRNNRTNLVFSRGTYNTELAIIGESPGYHEDQQGIPFCGPSGELLNNMIKAMGYKPNNVYITNVCKCRPPNNRKPTPDEIEKCKPFLVRQLDIVRPKVIVTLGATAMEALLGFGLGITKRRGIWVEYNNIKVMPTFHPAACLRNHDLKHDVWKDLQEVIKVLNDRE